MASTASTSANLTSPRKVRSHGMVLTLTVQECISIISALNQRALEYEHAATYRHGNEREVLERSARRTRDLAEKLAR